MKNLAKIILLSGVVFFTSSCAKTIVLSDNSGHTRTIRVYGTISTKNINDQKMLQFSSVKGTSYTIHENLYNFDIK